VGLELVQLLHVALHLLGKGPELLGQLEHLLELSLQPTSVRDRDRDRQTDRQRETERQGQTERNRETDFERQRAKETSR
jgi:hypothetical protein